MPRLLAFFVEFLLRSKVLPEFERNLRRSLEVIAIAQKELPNMSNLSKATPDQLSVGFQNCWGKKADTYSLEIPMSSGDEPADTDAPTKNPSDGAIVGETAAKDGATGWGNPSADNNTSEWGPAAAQNTWGTAPEGSPWGELVPESVEPTEGGDDDLSPWLETAPPESLLTLLGPTGLPLTHTTGIVERSMRRVKAVIPPPSNPPKSAPQGEGIFEPDHDAVEADLDRLFTKVILSPMIDWDAGDSPIYSRPAILKTSQGLVVDPANSPPEGSAGDGSAATPYNPLHDDITLLVLATPEKVELLSEGMGLGGTWVQIVRHGDGATKKKKKKGKSKKMIPSFGKLTSYQLLLPASGLSQTLLRLDP